MILSIQYEIRNLHFNVHLFCVLTQQINPWKLVYNEYCRNHSLQALQIYNTSKVIKGGNITFLVRTSDLPGSREPVQAAHPIRGGTAPTIDPTQVLRMVCLFMGV